MKLLNEIILYTVFALVIGALSVWPPYQLVDDDRAIVSLVFSHAGNRVSECRRMSQEEMNKLPPNMRKPDDCPRKRHPVSVELRSGSDVLYRETISPSGIWADGKASIYKRIEVQSGVHEIFFGMNDSGDESSFDFEKRETIDLPAGRNLVVQFDEQTQQILIR
jgi:hypothetical protein